MAGLVFSGLPPRAGLSDTKAKNSLRRVGGSSFYAIRVRPCPARFPRRAAAGSFGDSDFSFEAAAAFCQDRPRIPARIENTGAIPKFRNSAGVFFLAPRSSASQHLSSAAAWRQSTARLQRRRKMLTAPQPRFPAPAPRVRCQHTPDNRPRGKGCHSGKGHSHPPLFPEAWPPYPPDCARWSTPAKA